MMSSLFQKTLLIGSFIAFILPIELLAQDHKLGTLPPPRTLTADQAKVASTNYQKYCSLPSMYVSAGRSALTPTLKREASSSSKLPSLIPLRVRVLRLI